MVRKLRAGGRWTARLVVLGMLALPFSAVGASHPRPESIPRSQSAGDEVIVHYAPDTPYAEVQAQIAARGGIITRQLAPLHAVIVRFPLRASSAVQVMQAAGFYAEPNRLRVPLISPNDPAAASTQWALTNMHVFAAWDVTHSDPGTVIAILDTGVDLNHPDLAAHLLPGYDVVDHDATPQDSLGHGTHVAGIANADTNNGIGVAGVAWNARTLPVRIVGAGGASSAAIAEGILYAVDHDAKVINLSLGGPGWVKIERDAVDYAAAHDVVVVAAAGNCVIGGSSQNPCPSSNIGYPASYDHVISVANSDRNNLRLGNSDYNEYVDIAAPGTDIYSTALDDAYATLTGTSMAAPQVAGVAALVWSAGHAATAQQVSEAVLCSALDRGTVGYDMYYGWGLVQADSAVNYLPHAGNCLPSVANDDFDTAAVISALPYHEPGLDTSHATSWVDDPASTCGVSEDSRTVWYRYTPAASGLFTVTTAGSTYDTVVSVFRGTRGSLVPVACNDDVSDQDTTSRVTFEAAAGQTYSIMVSSLRFEGYAGTLVLNVDPYAMGCAPISPGSPVILCSEE